MQLLIIVLNRVNRLDELIETMVEHGFTGATILSSTGMLRELAKSNEDFPLFGSLRYLIDTDREESKTIFMVLHDEQIEAAKQVVRTVVGDLSKPDTAVLFVLPILSVEGIEF